MRIDVLTIFPRMFEGPMTEAILYRAQEVGLVDLRVHDLRDYTTDRHRTVDDYPFGGGPGMVMKPEPLFAAVDAVTAVAGRPQRIILTTPQGRVFDQDLAWELSRQRHLLIICGRYEGVDERVREALVTDEVSIGDYVLTGGELPAMVIIDAVVRLIPGVVGGEESVYQDSFEDGLLEGPQYTRPREFRGLAVPEVLLSGHHEAVRRWRRRQALRRTLERRPDLLARARLTDEDRAMLEELRREGPVL
ncbi:MAG: tRNA (guanosine(37)-N1)-methyltransferase TrmD [Thermaerobacter sp.]|nr:tRNA (guanosine(37)-N1)-methyltransferase TrmD [Bacillota bacterium]REJ38095.1 MAG: tRNA (guanosine(37)-N1)-methyltransferase TrmD [Bacillota bacterium]